MEVRLTKNSVIDDLLDEITSANSDQPEFLQAVDEMAQSIGGWYGKQKDFRKSRVFQRLAEPDRVISFRVSWRDDNGVLQHNRGWRVQFSHILGPYKGGLRFAPSVTESILKFLGYEQIFKNALTGLPMGGAKGGSNFDPKGKSPAEIERFCQSFMTELSRHIGPDIDVPAGDIGVGQREISLLYGHYLRLSNTWHGALTGKGCNFGGSAVRTEATGYGCVYFCCEMLSHNDMEIEGKRMAISGSGNVALHAAEKAIDMDATVLSVSDSDGVLEFKDGLTKKDLGKVKTLKGKGGRLSDLSIGKFHKGKTPWNLECDIAMPCATQNELDEDAAKTLVEAGVSAVCEGANMPLTAKASEIFRQKGILHAPGKAANAGGVAVSGLEQSQNAMRQSWSAEKVDQELRDIMKKIHGEIVSADTGKKQLSYVDGANLAAFKRVAHAFHSFGSF
ncbi:NADP-specific glutamate dehydrogenase [Labrenzia sp. R4_1]|uniref:NADP-specific glutamate dehydrogenase n=1 Tax=Labrenzia sp. R4_1 TaxID=2821106 RepID=UPI001ADBCBA9|nr:NADP-specific glutamate dehydrogenase [Labrenzia sp. R4_1]MBO9427393.1 NADP-specific glutamate dehydrogenase [Labrenzia sp. R4_1]